MKYTILLALFVLALVAAPSSTRPADADEALLERLDWLEGRWVSEEGGDYIEETWGPAREDALVGSLRWARQGNVWLYELMSIEADDEHGLVFRLRHFDRNLKPWKSEAEGPLTYPLADMTADRVVFENPGSESPRRFVYEREDDRLTLHLEAVEGPASRFEFELDE